MKANFLMAIAVFISGTVAAQENITVKAAQSANANNKADIKNTGETSQLNTNVSANASATGHVKADAGKQTGARVKNEGEAALATVAEKKDNLKTETSNAAAAAKHETTVRGEANASVNRKNVAADVATATRLKTEAVQTTESSITSEGKAVVNSTFETKKNVEAKAKGTATVVKKGVADRGESSISAKAGKKVKVDASYSQEAKVKPSSIGVKTRVTSASGLNLR